MGKQMIWADIVEQITSGAIDINDDVIVYDQATGDEVGCDLIQFDDTGEICIVINPDNDVEGEEV
jgi:hypothetical protein